MEYGSDANPSQIFLPDHAPGGFASTFVVRVDGLAEDRLAVIRDTIRSVDTEVPVFSAKTMEQRLEDALTRPRFYSVAMLLFAGFALLLSIIGVYGVVSYAVAQRTREMGVRLALGTTPARLRGVLLWQGLLPVLAGAVCGIAGATVSGRFLASLVEGAKSVDATTLALALVIVSCIAATSIWTATRRIAGLDIADVLRVE